MRTGILLGLSVLLTSLASAQEQEPEALVIKFRVETRIVTALQEVDWNYLVEKDTVNGRPVVVSIDGDNFFLRVTFTSFYQDTKSVLLVAQTEVSHHNAEKSGWNKSLSSQVVKLGIPLIYYPLGKDRKSEEGHIMVMEILLTGHETPEIPETSLE